MGNFRQFLTELSARETSVFSFQDNNLSTRKYMDFHQTCLCIDIMEIWFRIANGQLSSIFDSYLPMKDLYFCFRTVTLVSLDGFSPNSISALILWRSGLGLLIGKFHQFLTELSATGPYFHFWTIT